MKNHSQPGRPHLMMGGQRIAADLNGNFTVPYHSLLREDLSSVLPGTRIKISYPGDEQRSLKNKLRMTDVAILQHGRVTVAANYFRCPCCWGHALGFMKFTEAAMILFKKEAAANADFKFSHVAIDDEGKPAHCMSIDADNGRFVDIEAHIKAVVLPIIQPLNDARDAIDLQILHQFGVKSTPVTH